MNYSIFIISDNVHNGKMYLNDIDNFSTANEIDNIYSTSLNNQMYYKTFKNYSQYCDIINNNNCMHGRSDNFYTMSIACISKSRDLYLKGIKI